MNFHNIKKGYLKLRANIKISGETQSFQGMGRPPTHSVVIKNWEGYLVCRGPTEEQGVPHWASQPGHQCQEDESPYHLALQTHGDCIPERKRAVGDGGTMLLNGQCADSQTHFIISSSTGAAAQKTPGTNREVLN